MRLSFLLTLLLIISLVGNFLLINKLQDNKKLTTSDVEDTAELRKKYPLLAQRILIENPNDILINFLPLRRKLREMTADYNKSFAFYFEYLPTGVSIGVNEKDDFIGASLIKLPVVMAFYHQQERTRVDFESKKIKIIKEDLARGYGDLWMEGEGAEITLGEAARLAILESDNTAANILARNTLQQDFDEVYEGLDIDIKSEGETTFISPKSYSSILKALYFSAVLSKDNSQKVLGLLSQSHFEDKLRAPLPKDIVVANKFGVYRNDLFQDCGIVYAPKRNYLLCMMSKSDETEARKRMAEISKTVYEYINRTNGF